MKYIGSKRRIVKDILPVILKERTSLQQWYVEPFVGGGNVIQHVMGNRMGSDSNPYVIQALLAIRDHIDDLPKNNREFTEEDYKQLRYSDAYPYKGYIGFTCSYSSKWLGGWRRDSKGSDYVREAYNSARKQHRLLQGCILYCCSYDALVLPPNCIIYCDPPYQNVLQYKNAAVFDRHRFFAWCRSMKAQGHTIFVSEYTAPEDFTCVYEKRTTVMHTQKYATERLYTL
jgi:DNA adenine methylase